MAVRIEPLPDLLIEKQIVAIDKAITQNREWAVRLAEKAKLDPQHHNHRLRLCNDAWVELEQRRNVLLGRHPDAMPH